MAPNDKTEFVIVRLSFLPNLQSQSPRITLTRKKHSPSGSMTLVRDWFDMILRREKSRLPPDLNVRYCEWRIMSGNAQIFTVDNVRFDKVLVVLGEEQMHWVFYQNMPMHRRIEGSAPLQFSYCACCLNSHYMKIIDVVKENIGKKVPKPR